MRASVIKSGNSTVQGPHQVAHTLISLNLSELFCRTFARTEGPIVSNVTGSWAHLIAAFSIQSFFSSHLIEHPKTFVTATGTSLLLSNASIAPRASCA